VGKNFFDARYAREQSGLLRPNGCLLSERDIRAKGAKLRLCNGEIIPLFENMYLVSGFSSTDSNERPLERFLRDKGGEYITDLFVEEVALVLMTRDGPALISGCAHNGVVSTCKKAGEILGRPIVTFIGGTHLQDSDAGRIEYSLKALLNMGIKRLGACHCNGSEANEYFARHYDGFFVNNAGSRLTL
jgi:7,8-dihydropterin-6-yl-methyl-4-(beta-D-ribofuranosyl)aminobenzene 5'-phosphate synthase